MKDWSQIKRAATPEELEVAIADLYITDPDLAEPFAKLIRAGHIVDSGRRRNGKILWTRADRLPTDRHFPLN